MASFRAKKSISTSHIEPTQPLKVEKKTSDGQTQKLFKRLTPNQQSQVGIFHHVVLIIDSSESLPLTYLSEFVNSLFLYVQFILSHRPLIRVAFMTLQNSLCYLELRFSSNLSAFEEVLRDGFRPSGHIALATGLDQAYDLLMNSGSAASSRRILYINFSNATLDSLDIFSVLEKLFAAQIQVDVVSLTNSFGVLDHISRTTGGRHLIVDREIKGGLLNLLKRLELRSEDAKIMQSKGEGTLNLQMSHNQIITDAKCTKDTVLASNTEEGKFIMVGFPVHICDDAICFCHNRHGTGFYECPFCYAIVCDISECVCCGLQLVMYPNLYRGALLHKRALSFKKLDSSLSQTESIVNNTNQTEDGKNSKGKGICSLCQMQYGTDTNISQYLCTFCDSPFCKSCSELLTEAKVACTICGQI
ncbi:TFIIH P44 [Giardia lamblia P15]|uniref:TFIIH P44 n=1 Tax=Giardia intestinalis (strain P15) TaxID=658858 RepID=E1EXR8_GIAIA|nr:TFIIH P44 [Giardia lamblia P15]